MAAEKFEPIKVDIPIDKKSGKPDRSEIGSFRIDLSQLEQEGDRVKKFMKMEFDRLQPLLDAYKSGALKEYTGALKWDNEAAVNQAMEDLAMNLNQLSGETKQECKEIIARNDPTDDLSVRVELDMYFDKNVIEILNSQKIQSIIKAAADRVAKGNIYSSNATKANEALKAADE